jgi:putative ATP-dependent endonuclease of OLD family
MHLRTVSIRDFRSVFVDDSSQPMRLDLGTGANTLVGPNNCGKSNVLRAISLAMDPQAAYVPDSDRSGLRPYSNPIITLTFARDVSRSEDDVVFDAVAAYTDLVRPDPTARAAQPQQVTLEVSFVADDDGARRNERLVVGAGRPPADSDAEDRQRDAIAALRRAVRFVLISTGESIESVLEGNFREILHSVVRDRLSDEFDAAERSRTQYVDGLQGSLLAPLRTQLSDDVRGLFPDIEALALSPSVSSIEETLSQVGVSLDDLVSTPLARKGTGVRGGLLVAMLSYLALNATRSMVFAVEEPEAFLHPAAQEGLRDHLERVAAVPGVTLLVSTHSPFIMSRTNEGRIFALAKDADGRTRVADTAAGTSDHAPYIGDLVRQESFDALLAASAAVPSGTKAVVLLEGEGDVFCLRKTADVLGRADLLDGLHLIPAGGTTRLVVQAVVLRAALEIPLVIVVDNDDDGRRARKTLTDGYLKFQGNSILTYAQAFPKSWREFPVEAEDVFAPELIASFVDHHGTSVVSKMARRPDDAWHYDLDQAAKEQLRTWLTSETRPHHVERWIAMLDLIRTTAGLDPIGVDPEALIAAASSTETATPSSPAPSSSPVGEVLILTDKQEAARYETYRAILVPDDIDLPEGTTHVGFYDSGIRPHIPHILADHPNLVLSSTTADQLRSTGRALDAEVAAFVDAVVATQVLRSIATGHVLLLSPAPEFEVVPEADADEARISNGTLVLPRPIKNTRRQNGRPVAWTVAPRMIPYAALEAGPNTTDQLDALIVAMEDDAIHLVNKSMGPGG